MMLPLGNEGNCRRTSAAWAATNRAWSGEWLCVVVKYEENDAFGGVGSGTPGPT